MQHWSLEKEKKSQKMSLRYNGRLCQTAGWYIANKMVNVWAMKLNPCSLLKARPNLLGSLAGSVCVLGEQRKVKESISMLYKIPSFYQFKRFQWSAFSFSRRDCSRRAFFIANQMDLQYFHIWSSGDKPMFDFLVKVMCSVWIWAPGFRLPTHTAHIHKSLSWLTEGLKAASVSSVQAKKKLRWWRHRTDNDYFYCLSNLSKGPLHLYDGPPTWMDFDIYMRKARPFLPSHGTMIWYRSLTYLTSFRAVAVFTHPLRISRFILFHKISGRDTNYMWHHIVKTLSRTSAWKEGWTGGRRRWKEASGCHSESIVDFFKTQRALL